MSDRFAVGGRDDESRAGSADVLGAVRRFVDGAAVAGCALAADAAGGVGLRVEVDEQDVLAGDGEGGGQVDRRGGLSDAALLIGDWQRRSCILANMT